MRAINLSNALVSAGHKVVLWSADFDHFSKKQRFGSSVTVDQSSNLQIRLIKSSGYKSNSAKIERLIENNIRKYNRIVPNESIILQSNRELYLHSIIVHKSTHYTCYIKCDNSWFYYNDVGNTFEYIGSYKDMIENKKTSDKIRPDACTMSTLCFYSLKE